MALRRSRLAFVILALVGLASATLAPAQKIVSAKSGLVYFATGRVWVDNSPLKSGQIKRQMSAGETLYTERGRAEVLLNPGTVLRVSDMSRFRLDDIRLTDSCVSLLSGSAVVTVKYLLKDDRVELHLGSSGVVTLARPGVYRFDAGKSNIDQARLRVFSGLAAVQRRAGAVAVPVKGGRAVELDDLQVARFDTKDTDALERWADARSRTPEPRGLRPIPPRFGPPTGAPKTQPDTPLEVLQKSLGMGGSSQPILDGPPGPARQSPGQ